MSESAESLVLRNGGSVETAHVPRHAPEAFRHAVLRSVASGRRVACLFGTPGADGVLPELFAVLADDVSGQLGAARLFGSRRRVPP